MAATAMSVGTPRSAYAGPESRILLSCSDDENCLSEDCFLQMGQRKNGKFQGGDEIHGKLFLCGLQVANSWATIGRPETESQSATAAAHGPLLALKRLGYSWLRRSGPLVGRLPTLRAYELIADLQGNTLRNPITTRCGATANEHTAEAPACRGLRMVRLLASHRCKPGSIPGGVAPGLLQVGIVQDEVPGQQDFSGISRFPSLYIPALLHTHPTSLIGSQDLDVKSRPNNSIPLHSDFRALRVAVLGVFEAGVSVDLIASWLLVPRKKEVSFGTRAPHKRLGLHHIERFLELFFYAFASIVNVYVSLAFGFDPLWFDRPISQPESSPIATMVYKDLETRVGARS
ncbi:hypothetical protein PR048_014762 [Dryococelus australis]|uniref:Uncharacterized protein n=1 Tax=Dryococelus australis TaxID=614101 RepID=A0ABQ9HFV6_9NEOP|nr:hypothetical protein PR048_014762 [Dryococelus australis]